MRTKFKKIIKVCPFNSCKKEFETFDGGQKMREFCSKSCAVKARKPSIATKKSISNSLIKWHQNNNINPFFISKYYMKKAHCLFCNKIFVIYDKKLKYCSKKCSSRAHFHSKETKEKIRQAQLFLVETGKHIGWHALSRKNKKPSFPEQYVMTLLNELNIQYEREFKVGKWFIDFANIDKKLALEIDGKQHELAKRKESDKRKDQFLCESGWKILRVKWCNKLTKSFRIEIINKIKNFFMEIT